MGKLILKIFSMSLGFFLLLSSILILTAPGKNAPTQLVATGMLAVGIILLGWPIYTFAKAARRKRKKVWEFTLEDGNHTVELEYNYWSSKRNITVDGVEIIPSRIKGVDHFEAGGVPCVLAAMNLWVRGKLVGGEKARRERIRQVEKLHKMAGYGQERRVGTLTKVKDALTTDYMAATISELCEALLQRLHNLEVEVEFYDERILMVRLAGQSIDGISIKPGSYDEHQLHYVISGMRPELASRLKARSKKVKGVRNVRWVGGPVARLLNSDVDLLQLQIEEGQTEIEIIPDKINQWVRIAMPSPGRGSWVSYTYTPVPGFPGVASEALPSRETFNLYNRIAQHIRNYMAQ